MSHWTNRISMGLVKPEQEPQDYAAMRELIERGQRDSSMIRNCLQAARYDGASGEDAYTMLAYHALRALEDVYERQLQLVNTMTTAPTVTVAPEAK